MRLNPLAIIRTGPVVKPISNLKYLQLSMCSNPACDRVLYRAIKKFKVASIVEIGLGDASRAENMIRIAKRFSGVPCVRYTGIDLFEGRSDSEVSIRLKDAHQRLRKYDTRLQLVPGEVFPALNAHRQFAHENGYDRCFGRVRRWFACRKLVLYSQNAARGVAILYSAASRRVLQIRTKKPCRD